MSVVESRRELSRALRLYHYDTARDIGVSLAASVAKWSDTLPSAFDAWGDCVRSMGESRALRVCRESFDLAKGGDNE